ncbi:MAG: monovalent cation:proton antiporter-2 (CPA2) family protein [Gammaproteobacteria bacterium]
MGLLEQITVYLGAAVVAVPFTKRLGLGAVLGYLGAGVAIGPWGLRLVADVQSTLRFAEFGVVLLLFVIGLELQPSRLWALRKPIFGLGAAQVALTGMAFALLGAISGLGVVTALIAGLGLAMSSTAFALQMLAEKNQLTTRFGRFAFAILLFQDIVTIPLLALIPLLGPGAGANSVGGGRWLDVAEVGVALAGIVIGGHYVLRYVLRVIAALRIPEVFVAAALLTVLGAALAMEAVGISMALGAFLAGVLLADSEYRHELEADIEPFKGLLLGLFFIAVGMSVDVGLALERPLMVITLTLGLLVVKFAVLFALGRYAGLDGKAARRLALAISQGGEFAFVIFGFAVGAQVMPQPLANGLVLVVTLSMAITPLLVAGHERWLRREQEPTQEADYDRPRGDEIPVIIAGFGRFGQIIARILRAKKIGFTALEINPEQVDFIRKFGNQIYYGDASRLDLLRAAKAERAKIFVLAIDDVEAALRTAETVRRHFPNLTICARARNRRHAYQLMDLGVTILQRETFHSSLELARQVLHGLGYTSADSDRAVVTFRRHDEERLRSDHRLRGDEERLIYLAKKAAQELEEMFERDAAEQGAGPGSPEVRKS